MARVARLPHIQGVPKDNLLTAERAPSSIVRRVLREGGRVLNRACFQLDPREIRAPVTAGRVVGKSFGFVPGSHTSRPIKTPHFGSLLW